MMDSITSKDEEVPKQRLLKSSFEWPSWCKRMHWLYAKNNVDKIVFGDFKDPVEVYMLEHGEKFDDASVERKEEVKKILEDQYYYDKQVYNALQKAQTELQVQYFAKRQGLGHGHNGAGTSTMESSDVSPIKLIGYSETPDTSIRFHQTMERIMNAGATTSGGGINYMDVDQVTTPQRPSGRSISAAVESIARRKRCEAEEAALKAENAADEAKKTSERDPSNEGIAHAAAQAAAAAQALRRKANEMGTDDKEVKVEHTEEMDTQWLFTPLRKPQNLVEDYHRGNTTAMHLLYQNVDTRLHGIIQFKDRAVDAWKALEKEMFRSTAGEKRRVKSEYNLFTYRNGDSMEQHFQRFREIVNKTIALGVDEPECDQSLRFLQSLPPTYSLDAQNIECSFGNNELVMAVVQERIQQQAANRGEWYSPIRLEGNNGNHRQRGHQSNSNTNNRQRSEMANAAQSQQHRSSNRNGKSGQGRNHQSDQSGRFD